MSFKSPDENETKPELSLRQRREYWKMLTDFFVKSKITASLGVTCLSVLCAENQPTVTRENGYQGKYLF